MGKFLLAIIIAISLCSATQAQQIVYWQSDISTASTTKAANEQWTKDGKGYIWNSGSTDGPKLIVNAPPAPWGRKALLLSVPNPPGGCRVARVGTTVPAMAYGILTNKQLPDKAWYSLWFNMPRNTKTTWLNEVGFKTAFDFNGNRGSDPNINFPFTSNGAGLTAPWYARNKMNPRNGKWVGIDKTYKGDFSIPGVGTTPLRFGQWNLWQCYYEWAIWPKQGRVEVWVNGQPWFSTLVSTQYPYPYRTQQRQWTPHCYLDQGSPTPVEMLVGPCMISSQRQ